ncbi:uncharacterized protein [Tursiops truncatus]|uniref:Atherin-like n=1 Tax=Tursiops truncatus TaxID=9739 RepID=A0A6J3RCR3_TURTR|nr:atherin-like [Tursiops truncatus]
MRSSPRATTPSPKPFSCPAPNRGGGKETQRGWEITPPSASSPSPRAPSLNVPGATALRAASARAHLPAPPRPAQVWRPPRPASPTLPPGPRLHPGVTQACAVYLGRDGACRGLEGGAEGQLPRGRAERPRPGTLAGRAPPRPRLPPPEGSGASTLGAGRERLLKGRRCHQALSRERAEEPFRRGRVPAEDVFLLQNQNMAWKILIVYL